MRARSQNTNAKATLALMLSITIIVGAVQVVKAAEITSAPLDSDIYVAGQTGYISASVYNDKSGVIRLTGLSAIVDYYYKDGTVYVQRFFTNATLPSEIQPGQTETYRIPISLPTNIASGYIDLEVQASSDLFVNLTGRWIGSDALNYKTALYIESPYKQSYEDSQQQLLDTKQLLKEGEAVNQNLNSIVLMLVVIAAIFGGLVAFLMFSLRRPKPAVQP